MRSVEALTIHAFRVGTKSILPAFSEREREGQQESERDGREFLSNRTRSSHAEHFFHSLSSWVARVGSPESAQEPGGRSSVQQLMKYTQLGTHVHREHGRISRSTGVHKAWGEPYFGQNKT